MSRIGWCLTLIILALAATACGASKAPARPEAAKTHANSTPPRCRVDTRRAKRVLRRIHADIARIRKANTHDRTSTATDGFINDLDRSRLPLKTENRLIDLASSAALGKCDDCFQALEAMRPIPAIAHGCR